MTTDHSYEIAHDERYYELLLAEYDAREKLDRESGYMIQMASDDPDSFGFRPNEFRTIEAAREALPVGAIYSLRGAYSDRLVVGDGERHYDRPANADDALAILTPEHPHHDYVARYAEARDAAAAARDAVDEHDSAGYHGWTRYMLCTSSNGHVHADTRCSTCRMTTTFAPVVSLSGSTATEAISALGETLCSVCYPDAPIAGKIGKLTKAQAKKVLRGESIR